MIFVRLALLAVFALLPAIAPAQQPSGDVVAGHVVSSVDGHPLAHAEVTLTDQRSHKLFASATSGDDGAFRFDAVPAGKYSLLGRTAGYLPAAYLHHEALSTAIVTGAGLSTEALRLELTPQAMISGHVTDESGDPVQQANVTLYRENPTASSARVTRFRTYISNDEGAFEFDDLAPGRYFLSATGRPWYAVHPPDLDAGEASQPYRSAVDPSLDVAYPMVFYPNASTSAEASPLTVQGGEEVVPDRHMIPARALTRTVPSPPSTGPTAAAVRFPMLVQEDFGVETPVSTQLEMTNGVQRLTGIPPGHYTVQQFTQGNNLPVHVSTVDLTSGSQTLDIAAKVETATASFTFHPGGGQSLPSQLRFNLSLADRSHTVGSPVSDKGTAELSNLPPGDYSFNIFGDNRALQPAELTVDGHPVPDRHLHIRGPGTLAVSVRLSSPGVRVEGFVRRDGKPGAAALVILVPAGTDTSEALFRRDQSDLDGSFSFNDVAPGNYIIVALDNAWTMHWSNLAELAPFLLHGVPLNIPENGPTHVKLAEQVSTQSH